MGKREFDRHSGTGRGHEERKDGFAGWGEKDKNVEGGEKLDPHDPMFEEKE
ncbi:hypothetical protein J8273_7943 [Carpediemonas membranifera]|uniref:Hyaluronan/mRNA-binding protein domain-containing protein n=1 Tax=Carpediemonas membranifera TaxID=201153 RepID=A0A8J6E1G2_9EUKA|nr:hypothetical protein J8273_7943 [Carpediemonas membranifera]|eukprot:KAG9390592.1 hypothetical protein J8273_7943 [Carpediemonas membranifera]